MSDEITPLERAARALASFKNYGSEKAWRYFVPEARAVLMAVREPSEGMLIAGDQAWTEGTLTLAIWQAMLDAALAE